MREIIEKAIETYGPEMQKTVAVEEMSELIKEICKSKRGEHNYLHIAEEIADVEIMLEQLKLIYNISRLVEVQKQKKLNRLQERIDNKVDF